MSFGSFLRRHTIKQASLLEGRALHDFIVRVAKPLDALIAATQRRFETSHPVFIVGPQRSGTTLFHKCFLEHHQVCGLNQATDYFPECFLTADLYFRCIRATRATDFLDAFDAKRDLWIRTWKNNGYHYTEGNRVWNKLGPNGKWLSTGDRAWAMRTVPRMVRRFQRSTGRPLFLSKCPANSLRIHQLCELFPGARFIHLQRDPRGAVNSMINIHRELGVRSWGPMPVAADELVGLTEYEQVAMQWVAITDAIGQSLVGIPEERKVVVRYEEFLRDPDGVLDEVVLKFGLERFQRPLSVKVRGDRMEGWRQEIPGEELSRIERILQSRGHGSALS